MDFLQYVQIYIVATITFFAIDMIWLGFVAKRFYRQQLGSLLAKRIKWLAAIVFYFLFIFGIVIFVLTPAIKENSVFIAVVYGGLFGFFTYATYDLTNLATIESWPKKLTFVDLAWGTILSSGVSLLTFLIFTKLFS